MNIIIFGASGDLAKRKLFPALAKLDLKSVNIIGFARTHYEKPFSEILKDFYSYEDQLFFEKIVYIKGRNYTDLEVLKPYLNAETFVYLSLPPEVYHETLAALKKFKYKGIAIEKPFGSNYEAFLQFKQYPIEKFFFIDHFLLKPLIVSWPKLIKTKNKLNSIINRKHLKNVKIVFKEEIGGEGRAYFDTNGLVKDMLQNHLSEVLAVIASNTEQNTYNELAEKRIHIFQNTQINEELSIFGQYNEYRHEMGFIDSTTETFSIVTLLVNLEKWKNVPFIIISGKGMNEKKTEIIFEFKREAFQNALDMIESTKYEKILKEKINNIRLICNVTPNNEIYLEIIIQDIAYVHTIFDKFEIMKHMHDKYGHFENHEIVFNSFIKNKTFDVVKFYEAKLLWKIYDCIFSKTKPLIYYSKGSDIPIEAKKLLEKIENINED